MDDSELGSALLQAQSLWCVEAQLCTLHFCTRPLSFSLYLFPPASPLLFLSSLYSGTA